MNWKVAPRGELSVAHKRPPCDSMIDRLMDSPIPVPLSLVVKNALKICSACSGGNPTPVSVTEISSRPSSASDFDCKLTSAGRFLHGIDGVEHEVHENLL